MSLYIQQLLVMLLPPLTSNKSNLMVHIFWYLTLVRPDSQQSIAVTEIITTLRTRNPQLLEEVSSLISELNRITTLWEEEWISGLQMVRRHHALYLVMTRSKMFQIQVDVSSRLRKLKNEISRVKMNERLEQTEKIRLIGDKYSVIMKPPIVQMERLIATVSASAQTPHEFSFQKTFLQRKRFVIQPLLFSSHVFFQLSQKLLRISACQLIQLILMLRGRHGKRYAFLKK